MKNTTKIILTPAVRLYPNFKFKIISVTIYQMTPEILNSSVELF
jgi:hypothetical protein